MPSENTEQRKLAAIIPQGGTDMVGDSALSRRVLPRSNDPFFGKDES